MTITTAPYMSPTSPRPGIKAEPCRKSIELRPCESDPGHCRDSNLDDTEPDAPLLKPLEADVGHALATPSANSPLPM